MSAAREGLKKYVSIKSGAMLITLWSCCRLAFDPQTNTIHTTYLEHEPNWLRKSIDHSSCSCHATHENLVKVTNESSNASLERIVYGELG
jgi:hypothetical protein